MLSYVYQGSVPREKRPEDTADPELLSRDEGKNA
jgi:hypothetical protein